MMTATQAHRLLDPSGQLRTPVYQLIEAVTRERVCNLAAAAQVTQDFGWGTLERTYLGTRMDEYVDIHRNANAINRLRMLGFRDAENRRKFLAMLDQVGDELKAMAAAQ